MANKWRKTGDEVSTPKVLGLISPEGGLLKSLIGPPLDKKFAFGSQKEKNFSEITFHSLFYNLKFLGLIGLEPMTPCL